MLTGTFTSDVAIRSRRFSRIASLRLLLALAYLTLEVLLDPANAPVFKTSISILFGIYSGLIVAYRSTVQVRSFALWIQFGDLLFAVLLVLAARTGEAALPLLLFYFLLAESSLLHSGREVLLVTAVILVFYTAWITSGEAQQFHFEPGSFMFVLVVAGVLAYYVSDQSHRIERGIRDILQRAGGESEEAIVRAVEEALQELMGWRRASGAILAFWDDSLEYHAMCQVPAQRDHSGNPLDRFNSSREWACFRGSRLDFQTNDVSVVDREGKPVNRGFDLHPYVIQKFELYNVVGCGLYDGKNPIGRLLLFNSVHEVRRADWKRAHEVARHFRDVVRHLLVVKHTEQEAYERECGQIAQDLHDGPLQSIISFEMRLQIIRKLLERDVDVASADIESLQVFSRDLVSEMRTFVHRMRPLDTSDTSLMAGARQIVDGFQRESNVSVTFVGNEDGSVSVPGKIGVEILQVIREALHNIYKHAQATHVLFSLEKRGSDIHVAIDDNGQGFPFGGQFSLEELELLRIGPLSIKQRIRTLGGTLTLESNPGHGSVMRARVPVF